MTNAAVGMPCPVCKVPLTMSERQGVEIDYCPQCRGVWLDRGELDKIIERSAKDDAQPATQAPPAPQQYAPPPPQGYANSGYGYGQPSKYPYGKRKKSFLEDLFD
jgi:uncharacterized protein